MEAEAAQLLSDAQQAREQAGQLRSDAEALISLAILAEELAAEYRELAENPKTVQTTTIFIYDQAGQLIGEYKNNSETIKEYIWLNDKPLVMVTNDDFYYIHADHLNTSKILTDQQQSIVWKAGYKPFGEVDITVNAVENNLRFPGQYFDQETEQSYNYHRYYDTQSGRYITSDPIGLAGGLNTYAYVGGNPVMRLDPSGLLFISPDPSIPDDSGPARGKKPECEECPNPVTIGYRGICDGQGPECAMGLRAAGIPGPYYGSTKTYSGKCLLSFGFLKVGDAIVSDYFTSEIGKAATEAAKKATGVGRTVAQGVATGSKVLGSPYTTAAQALFAVDELLKQCECKKK